MKSKAVVVLAIAAMTVFATSCNKLKARDQLNKGVQAFKSAQYPQAVERFKTAVEYDPTFATARLYLATAYMQQYIPGVRLLTFVIFLDLGLTIFEWSDTAKLFLSKAFIVIVASSLTYLGVKVINLLLDVWKRRTMREGDRRFDEQLFSVIRRSLVAFIIVVAVLVTAQNLGINITAVITSQYI